MTSSVCGWCGRALGPSSAHRAEHICSRVRIEPCGVTEQIPERPRITYIDMTSTRDEARERGRAARAPDQLEPGAAGAPEIDLDAADMCDVGRHGAPEGAHRGGCGVIRAEGMAGDGCGRCGRGCCGSDEGADHALSIGLARPGGDSRSRSTHIPRLPAL